MGDYVYLECVKVKSKLRVRIVSPGYYNDANCMFPKDIRAEGAKYKVHRWNVSLITTRGKYYYAVKTGIEVLPVTLDPKDVKIFEDTSTDECAVCMCEKKDTIINPCGHFYMCSGCAHQVDKCPICRGPVSGFINKKDMD